MPKSYIGGQSTLAIIVHGNKLQISVFVKVENEGNFGSSDII